MKTILTFIILAGSINCNARAFELGLKGGMQVSTITKGDESSLSAGKGYTFTAEGRYIIKKGLFTGIGVGITKLQQKATYEGAEMDPVVNPMQLKNANIIFGNPSISISALIGYRKSFRRSAISLTAEAGYVNNAVKDIDFFTYYTIQKDMYFEHTSGIRYGANLGYSYRLIKGLRIGAYAGALFYNLNSKRLFYGYNLKHEYNVLSTGAGLSVDYRL